MIEKAKEILKCFINEEVDKDCFPINPLEEKTRNEIKFVLKAIENLEKENEKLKKEHYETLKSWYKLKKTVDTLINKKVYIYGIKSLSSINQYNNIIIGTEFNKLTREEYELLKGVLEDET